MIAIATFIILKLAYNLPLSWWWFVLVAVLAANEYEVLSKSVIREFLLKRQSEKIT